MRIGLRGRILLFFVATAIGAVVALGLGLWVGYHRHGGPDMFHAFVQGGLAAGFGILALVTWMWFVFDLHFAKPIERIASDMRTRTHADVPHEIDDRQVGHLGDLAAAASSTAATLSQARNSLAETVARETAQLLSDKSKLEHLLGDVPPAVLLCTGRHHLVFYNGVAQSMLAGAKTPICLGRSVFDYLDDGAIRLAHRRLLEAELPDAVIEFVCCSPCGSRRLAGRMRLAGDNGGDPGAYVTTLRDVTSELVAYARRDHLLSDIFETLPPIIATLKKRMSDGGEVRDVPSLAGELEVLAANLVSLRQRFESCCASGWPMAPADLRELSKQLHRTLAADGIRLDVRADLLAARCNAFDIAALFAHLARRLVDTGDARALAMNVRERQEGAELALSWEGSPVADAKLRAWLAEPVHEGGLACDAILRAHASRIEQDGNAANPVLTIVLPRAEHLQPVPEDRRRSVVYDFDLLSRVHTEKIADAKLDELTYVVFDTETTGLLPERGDEIVQIAAVRIVNGKRVKGEVFETLVNPGRSIPAGASAVHRVTDAMVADAPGVLEVVERFHRFSQGAVLVAHNAPFDMEFLYRRERELGIRFLNPILDTVLLSAAVYGQSEQHTLDALARRLAVPLTEAERHTAMGDAAATAEVFLKLKATLVGRGLERFGDVLAEIRRHRRLVPDLNGVARNN